MSVLKKVASETEFVLNRNWDDSLKSVLGDFGSGFNQSCIKGKDTFDMDWPTLDSDRLKLLLQQGTGDQIRFTIYKYNGEQNNFREVVTASPSRAPTEVLEILEKVCGLIQSSLENKEDNIVLVSFRL